MRTLNPPTRGTPDQVAWAKEIQQRFIQRYQYALDRMTDAEFAELKKASAAYWINHRKQLGMTFVNNFINRASIRENKAARRRHALENIDRY